MEQLVYVAVYALGIVEVLVLFVCWLTRDMEIVAKAKEVRRMGTYRPLPDHARADTMEIGQEVEVPVNGVLLKGKIVERGMYTVRVVVEGGAPEGEWVTCDKLVSHEPVYPKMQTF